MIQFKLKSSYMEDKGNFSIYYVVVPYVVLALLIHLSTAHNSVNKIFWAFCAYLEAVSVLPQLRLMQNTKIVEPFTAHYVFALGVGRFLSCTHLVLQVLDSSGRLLIALGYGLWPSMVLLSEIVQTFILADFCYYYVKSVVGGQLVLSSFWGSINWKNVSNLSVWIHAFSIALSLFSIFSLLTHELSHHSTLAVDFEGFDMDDLDEADDDSHPLPSSSPHLPLLLFILLP